MLFYLLLLLVAIKIITSVVPWWVQWQPHSWQITCARFAYWIGASNHRTVDQSYFVWQNLWDGIDALVVSSSNLSSFCILPFNTHPAWKELFKQERENERNWSNCNHDCFNVVFILPFCNTIETRKKARDRQVACPPSDLTHFAASSVDILLYIRKMLQNYIDEHIKQNFQAGRM